MKQYVTLIAEFHAETEDFFQYLSRQNIKYRVGGELAVELKKYGFIPNNKISNTFLLRYVVLIEEYELSAILLTYDNISLIRNRPFLNFKNKIRNYFKWILNLKNAISNTFLKIRGK